MATLFTVGIEVQASQAQQALGRIEKEFARVASSATGAQQAARDLGREFQTAANGLKYYTDAQGRLRAENGRFISQTEKVAAGIAGIGDEFQKANRSQMDFERGALAVSAAMGALAFKAKQYINSVTQVGQAVQGAVAANSTLAKDAKGLDQAFRQLTKELNYSTNSLELNKAAYDVLSAGVSETADVLAVMKAGVAGAKGGFSDLGTITDAVTTIMNAYGKSAKEAQTIVDQMITTQNDGKIVAAQYGQQIGVVAAGAANAGVKLEELNAAVSVATVAGVQVSSTFTGLRQAISSIVSPSEQAKKLAKELGIEFSQNALKSKGFAGVLKDVAAATKGNAEQITKLFGSVEAKAVIDPILNNLQKYEQFLNNQSKAAGSAAAATDKVTKGLGAAQAALANIATEANRKVFEMIEPGVTLLTNATTALAKVFVDLPEPIQKVVIGIGLVAAGVAAATAATIAFNAVGLTASAIMGGLATAVGILTAPITLVVIGIGAAALAFKELYDSSENLRKVLARFGDAAVRIFNVFARAVARVTGTFAEYEGGATNALKGTGDAIARFVEGGVSAFERFAKFIEEKAGVINATIKTIGDGFNAVADAALYIFDLKTQGKEQADINLRQRQAQRRIAEEQIPPYLRNRAKVAKPAATSAATPAAIASSEMSEEDRKKLEQEMLRQEKELADKRKQEFEERQRREREAFQDRRQYEDATFSQRSNFELRIFDLQTRHQQILKDQRLDAESEIAKAVIKSQQEIENQQRQIERRRIERQFQQQQRALQIAGLGQQLMFEQGQANQAVAFNRGQMIGGGGGSYEGGSLASFNGTFGQNTIMSLAAKYSLNDNSRAGNHFGSRRSGSRTHHGSGNAVDFGDREQGVSVREAHKKFSDLVKELLGNGLSVNIEEIIWNGHGSPLGDYFATGGKGPFFKLSNGKKVPIGNGLAQSHTDHLHMAETTPGGSPYAPGRVATTNMNGLGGDYRLAEASYYGPGFHGKKTANGEIFNQNALTAAHKTLPFGTMVKVRNPKTGKETTVRINDRGPFSGNREFDLSKAAADAIGFTSQGVGKLQFQSMGDSKSQPYAQAGVPNVTVTALDIQTKLNEAHFEASVALREQALEQAELNAMYREQAEIVPRMMRENVAQLQEQTRQLQIESDLMRLQGEERKQYLAQLEYEKLYKGELLNLEQDIANASNPAEKLALQAAKVQLLKQESEIVAAIAVKQAAEDQLEAQRKQVEWADSQIQSLKGMTYAMSAMNEQQQMAARMADNMGNSFADAFTRFVTGTGTAQDAFAGFMSSMASVFAQEVQKMVATAIASKIFPSLLNLFGGGATPSLFSGGFSGGPGFSIGGITGGVASGVALPGFSVPALADGGIVRSPTMALIGERGPEAVVPLDQMGGGSVNSVVNVTVNNDGSVKTDSNQGNELGKAIQRAVVDEIARQKRSGGLLASVK